MIIIIIITLTLLLYQLQYYSHCYYKFWQYYAKYTYHVDKLSHSHSSLRGGWGGGGLAPTSLSYYHHSHVSQPKMGQVEMLRFY